MLKVNGDWIEDQEQLQIHGREHFANIFSPAVGHSGQTGPRLGVSSLQAQLTETEKQAWQPN